MDDQNKGVNERWAPPDTKPERGYAAEDRPGEPGTAEVRAEIAQTRAEMEETIDVIQDRLRPGNVVSRAANTVRDATVGKVREVAHSAQDAWTGRARDWDDDAGYGIVDRIREHPVPAMLAAVSLAWLAFGGRRHYDRAAIYGSTAYGEPYIRETRLPDDTPGAAYTEGGSSIRDAAEDAAARARSATRDAGQRLRQGTRRAQSRLERMAHANPLALGALAAAVGATVGLALPETHKENELMGEAKDAMVDRARGVARGAAERVQDAAQQAQKVAEDVLSGTRDREEY